MGVSADGGASGRAGKAVDVEVNVVPFIDLMSCLVAFLLVTAVWSNLAQIRTTPRGPGPGGDQAPPALALSVLVTVDAHWVGLATGDRRRIPKVGGEYDWAGLENALGELRRTRGDRHDVEIAADDGVAYQAVISTMDTAIAEGLPDIGYLDPPLLSVRFGRP